MTGAPLSLTVTEVRKKLIACIRAHTAHEDAVGLEYVGLPFAEKPMVGFPLTGIDQKTAGSRRHQARRKLHPRRPGRATGGAGQGWAALGRHDARDRPRDRRHRHVRAHAVAEKTLGLNTLAGTRCQTLCGNALETEKRAWFAGCAALPSATVDVVRPFSAPDWVAVDLLSVNRLCR